MNSRKLFTLVLMVAAGVCAGTVAQPARATYVTPKTVGYITFWNNNSTGSIGQLYIALSDMNSYVAYVNDTSHPNCNRGWDAIKSWASIAQAAQLSGKKLSLDYTYVSGCGNIINYVQLEN